MDSLYFEARCRIQDPVYGCVGTISHLHQQIHNAESQLAKTQAEIAFFNANALQEVEPQSQQMESEVNHIDMWLDQGPAGQSLYGLSNQATPFMWN